MWKKVFMVLLIVLLVNLYLQSSIYAERSQRYTKADLTEHSPEIRTSPPKDLPQVKGETSYVWLWALLGAAAAGGLAAFALGGGGGGGGGSDGNDSGTVGGTW